jgi:hypothetical protein
MYWGAPLVWSVPAAADALFAANSSPPVANPWYTATAPRAHSALRRPLAATLLKENSVAGFRAAPMQLRA